jgi:short-subunit dehydrogenase
MSDTNSSKKVILITGTSSGFGLLTAARLSARGFIVYATLRDVTTLKPLVDEVCKRRGDVIIREIDVTKPETIEGVVSEIQSKHQRIDVVINNAGFGLGGFFEDLSEQEIRHQMDVNFFGVQSVCREVIPLMRQRKEGLIINISSIAGLSGTPALGAYNASKWALEGFSESLYHELALFNINVVLVEPGSYPTKIFSGNARYSKGFDNPQSPYFKLSQKLRAFVQKEMAKNKKDPEEVAILIERIIDTKKPKLRYVSDFQSWLRVIAGRVIPPSVYNYIFRKAIYGNVSNTL